MRFQFTKEDIAEFIGDDQPDEKILKPIYDFILRNDDRLNNYRKPFDELGLEERFEKYVFDIVADEIFNYEYNEMLGRKNERVLLELICDNIKSDI